MFQLVGNLIQFSIEESRFRLSWFFTGWVYSIQVVWVVPKSYQWEEQPRKTENELTNIGEDSSKPNPNANPNPNAITNPNTKPNPKKKKLRKEKLSNLPDSNSQIPKRTVPRTITQPTVPDGNLLQTT